MQMKGLNLMLGQAQNTFQKSLDLKKALSVKMRLNKA
jgi:hypothetical protein